MTSPSPSQSQQPSYLAELRLRFQALQKARAELATQRDRLTKAGDAAGLNALSLVLRDKLADFNAELRRDPVTLPDGRQLLKHDYEGLMIFAEKNGLIIEHLLEKVTIKNSCIVSADFCELGLRTLEGLGLLFGLQKLDVSRNKDLTSLAGTPEQVEVLKASFCGLIDSLLSISRLRNLRELNISRNLDLTSLLGAPEHIEVLTASGCNLLGDLSGINSLGKIRDLDVSGNESLISLAGTPEQVEVLMANDCGLAGNLRSIKRLQKLRNLCVQKNTFLISLEGIPSQVQELYAYDCALKGTLSVLGSLTKLKKLFIGGNPKLDRQAVKAQVDFLRATGAPLQQFQL